MLQVEELHWPLFKPPRSLSVTNLKKKSRPRKRERLAYFFLTFRGFPASRIYLEVPFSISFSLKEPISNGPIIYTPELYLQNANINYPEKHIKTLNKFKTTCETTNQPISKYQMPRRSHFQSVQPRAWHCAEH